MEEKYNRRQFLKTLEGIVIGSVPLIYNCSKNPINSEQYLNNPIIKNNNEERRIKYKSDSIIKNGIECYMQTDKKDYKLGEKVEMRYRVANVGKEPYGFSFSSSQWYDFNVKKLDEEIWRWSYDKFFAMAITNFRLNPDEYKEFIENWNMVDNNGDQIKPGTYLLSGTLGSFRTYPDGTISVAINIKP